MKHQRKRLSNTETDLFSTYNLAINTDKNMLTIEENLDEKFPQQYIDDNISLKNIKTNNNSYSHIFPVFYFFSAIILPFVLIVINILQEKNIKGKISEHPLHPFPVFFSLKTIEPHFFSFSILTISMAGLLNVWFFSSILLQRFSVPELRKNKMKIHSMFIIGIFANIIYIFFGFSPELFKTETIRVRRINISLSLIVFLVFIFFNILFSIMTIFSLSKLEEYHGSKDNKLRKNIRIKRILVYLSIIIMFIYIMTVILETSLIKHLTKSRKIKKHRVSLFLHCIMFFFPYILYILNAFMNLSYYNDIMYIQEQMNLIIDQEYFINKEERALFILNY